MSEAPRVFVSYSHRDREWVRKFADRLDEAGIPVWMDEKEIAIGEQFLDRLEEAIRESDTLIFVITPENVNSPNAYFELGAALGMGKKVLAIVANEVAWQDLPEPIKLRRYVAMESPEETAQDIVGALT